MPERSTRVATSLSVSNFRTGSKQSNQKLTNCYQTCLKYCRRFATRSPQSRISLYG